MAYTEFTKESLSEMDFISPIIDAGVVLTDPVELENGCVKYKVDWDGNPFDEDDLILIMVDIETKDVSAIIDSGIDENDISVMKNVDIVKIG